MLERIQDVWLAFDFLAWSGLHMLLRLLSLHLCNEYLSLPKKKKKKKKLNVSKSAGFLVQAQPLASATIAALPGINFITGQQTVFFFFFFFFFLGYRGIAHSPSARSCRRRQTNLICARTAA